MSIATGSPPLTTSKLPGVSPGRIRRLWYDVRDRLLVDARFQRWAAAFPMTRFMARRRQRELFDLVAGFVYTQVLASLVELDLLSKTRVPQRMEELARQCGLPLASMERLVHAAIPLRLLSRRAEGQVGLGDLGAALLGNPGVAAMVSHHALLYRDLADPVGLLKHPGKQTELSAYWSYARNETASALSGGMVAEYSRLMAVSQSFIVEEILAAYPIARHKKLLDIGGGQGAFVLRAAAHAPQLEFGLFDLPAVAARAQAAFAEAGIANRATASGGDLFRDALPAGADLACLIRVLYDHEDERALRILTSARAALPPDGTLLIAEPMAGTRGAERMGGAYFGFYLFAMKGGNARSADDLSQMARAAGFSSVRLLKTHSPLLTSVLVAKV
jgi:demethylspheroidene O-methyltransferase